MRGSTHLMWGALAGMAIGGRDLPTLAMCAGAGAVAALVPDWLQINIPGASKQVKGMFGHRGMSHWVWAALAVGAALYAIGAPWPVIVAAVAGWLSHIALDALADGVPAFWPFGRITLGHVKTGGKLDSFTGAAALVLCVLLLAFIL